MSITAMDIQQQGFEHSLRGYDIEQVDVFLERVAQEVDAMATENAQLRSAVQRLKAELDAQPEVEEIDPEELYAAEERADKAEQAAREAMEQTRAAAEQVLASENRAKAAEQKISELERRLAEKSDMDSSISNAFIAAQRAADNLKEEARAEGERIYRESEAKAREFIREALIEKQRILNEVDALTVSCDKFRNEYKALLAQFSAEADTKFSDIQTPVVTESAVDAALPVLDHMDLDTEDVDAAPVLRTDAPMDAALADDDLDIDEL